MPVIRPQPVLPAVVKLSQAISRGRVGAAVARVDAGEISELHARVCKAIADAKRLQIINELRDRPRTVGELVEALGISQANASQHLAILRDRGIVTARRAGANVHYSLTSMKIVRAVDLLYEFMSEQAQTRRSLAG